MRTLSKGVQRGCAQQGPSPHVISAKQLTWLLNTLEVMPCLLKVVRSKLVKHRLALRRLVENVQLSLRPSALSKIDRRRDNIKWAPITAKIAMGLTRMQGRTSAGLCLHILSRISIATIESSITWSNPELGSILRTIHT